MRHLDVDDLKAKIAAGENIETELLQAALSFAKDLWATRQTTERRIVLLEHALREACNIWENHYTEDEDCADPVTLRIRELRRFANHGTESDPLPNVDSP